MKQKTSNYKNALSEIRRCIQSEQEKGHAIEKILVHPTYIARGFVFVSNHKYILINQKDLDAATAELFSIPGVKKDYISMVHGVPIWVSEPETQEALCGILCAYSLG